VHIRAWSLDCVAASAEEGGVAQCSVSRATGSWV